MTITLSDIKKWKLARGNVRIDVASNGSPTIVTKNSAGTEIKTKVPSDRNSRKSICRKAWYAHRSEILSRSVPFPSTGIVYFVDPTSTTNGSGTFADPFNVIPPVTTYRGNTVLIAEGTTVAGQFNTSGAFSYNIGTYSRMDGSRLVDPGRVATINSSAFVSGIQFSGAGANQIVVSGVRITGARNAAGSTYGVYAGNNTIGSSVIIEHCVIDNCVGSIVSTLISARGEKTILRFNKLIGTNTDLIWVQATTPNSVVEIYGNELIVSSPTNINGPDAIQLARTVGGAFRRLRVYCNFIDHCASTKQGFIVSGNPPADGLEDIRIYRNFWFGMADVTTAVDLSGNGSSQVAISIDVRGARVYSNYFEGWRLWCNSPGSAEARSVFAYNLCHYEAPTYNSTTSPMVGSAASGSDYVIVAHNTFVCHSSLGATTPIDIPVLRLAGSNNIISNNIFLGKWRHAIRLFGVGQIETNNVFFDTQDRIIVSNTSGSSVIIDTSSQTTYPNLDFLGQPAHDSYVVGGAEPVTDWDGTLLNMEDPFGSISEDADRQWIGAIQCNIL